MPAQPYHVLSAVEAHFLVSRRLRIRSSLTYGSLKRIAFSLIGIFCLGWKMEHFLECAWSWQT